MRYVALLRGINVGGKNRVEMARLKSVFESLGFYDVTTYINSGNVLFSDSAASAEDLSKKINQQLEHTFDFPIPTLVRSETQIEAVCAALPADWVNDQSMKCDVMFLWPALDSPDVLERVPHKPEIEDVRYLPGVLLWRVDRDKVNRGQLLRIIGTDVYKQMTIRNCNTVRKLHQLLHA